MRHRILQLSLSILLSGAVFTGIAPAQNTPPPAPAPNTPPNPATPPDPNAQPPKSWGAGWTNDGKGHWKKTSSSTPDAPAPPPLTPDKAQDQSQKKPSTADDNPFPEEQSKAAAKAADSASDANPPRTAPAAKDGNYSSSRDQLKGADLLGDKDSRTSDGAGGTILNPQLAAQDAKVGGFYLRTGDFKGAYSRYQEATKVDPGNADAVFGLAEAARGLNHRQEAIDNYTLYLQALPDGSKAKNARKALKDLGAPAPQN